MKLKGPPNATLNYDGHVVHFDKHGWAHDVSQRAAMAIATEFGTVRFVQEREQEPMANIRHESTLNALLTARELAGAQPPPKRSHLTGQDIEYFKTQHAAFSRYEIQDLPRKPRPPKGVIEVELYDGSIWWVNVDEDRAWQP